MPIAVTVVYSPGPRTVREIALELELGSVVAQALQATGWLADLLPLEVKTLEVGVWGRKVPLEHVLREGDRVEMYRPLKVDPKAARRERFTRQGAKAAGLFTKRRSGAKAGY